MSHQLDHLFCLCEVGAPAADRIAAAGFTEGPPNTHPGQGTANRRFFFDNGMLELLWVQDRAEAESAPTRTTRLWERWSRRGDAASAIGICLRPGPGGHVDDPFIGEHYRPMYLPEDQSILIADNVAQLGEPMIFYLPWMTADHPALPQGTVHENGARSVSSVRLHSPCAARPSDSLRAIVDGGFLNATPRDEELLEVVLDAGRTGTYLDLRPALPLKLHW